MFSRLLTNNVSTRLDILTNDYGGPLLVYFGRLLLRLTPILRFGRSFICVVSVAVMAAVAGGVLHASFRTVIIVRLDSLGPGYLISHVRLILNYELIQYH